MRIIDISQEVLSCETYEGDPTPSAERITDMERGELYNLSAFSMCAHNGTHIDAPLHFFEDGRSVDKIPLEYFVGECFVAEEKGVISAEKAQKILKKARKTGADKRILIKGDVTVAEDGARVFADADILLLGNESQSVGPLDSPMAVHKILLSKNIVLLEGIVLDKAREGRYILSCAPLNLAGFEGSPCRAILIER
ncbi:MAG: cyclase family protein [Clostridia bacterium]|nr:cyclase family protein [Clostridia bacterium]